MRRRGVIGRARRPEARRRELGGRRRTARAVRHGRPGTGVRRPPTGANHRTQPGNRCNSQIGGGHAAQIPRVQPEGCVTMAQTRPCCKPVKSGGFRLRRPRSIRTHGRAAAGLRSAGGTDAPGHPRPHALRNGPLPAPMAPHRGREGERNRYPALSTVSPPCRMAGPGRDIPPVTACRSWIAQAAGGGSCILEAAA